MLITQLNRTYSATEYPDPVQARSAVAISDAGPPAMIEARWKPSEEPLYRNRAGKHSAISAACGP